MSTQEVNTPLAVTKSLARWHQMISHKDFSDLHTIVHPDATFHSPMAFSGYKSATALIMALSTVIQVFQEFTYYRQFSSDDGLDIVLEFGARVGDKNLKGVDLIRFNKDGLIIEFEVMIRPLSGLQALGLEMGNRLGNKLPEFKIQN